MKWLAVLVTASIVFAGADAPAQGGQPASRPSLAGRPLTEALRQLQKQGLNIVFSSEIVKSGMRVGSEPAGRTPREVLDAVLTPHGLAVREGPAATLVVVRAAPRPSPDPPPAAHGHIRGVVLDARTATPLEGVMVRLVEAGDTESLTDPDGRFDIGKVPTGRHTLFASLVGYTLARPEVDLTAGGIADLTIALSAGTATYTELVQVVADPYRTTEATLASAKVIRGADLFELRGVLSDDPLRAVQALPGVTAVNDFRSEFSVRGTDYRHIGLTIDGMTTDWPVHSVYDDAGGGSVALVNADVVDQITLFGGAYPQDRPARTGAWVDFALREGSRQRVQARGALSMTSASIILEGPIGSAGRGSWLVATRQSYVQWILRRMNSDDTTAFGFTDVQAKAVWDRSPTQRFDATVIVGRSLLDLRRNDNDPNLVSRGDATAVLLTAGWRATRGSSLTTAHRVSASRSSFDNERRDGEPLGSGSGQAVAYRGSVTWMARPSTMLQTGLYLQRDYADYATTRYIEQWSPAAVVARPQRVNGSRLLSSVDVRITEHVPGGIVLDGGALISDATDSAAVRPSPWGAISVPLGERWSVRSAAGTYRQHPGLDHTVGTFAVPSVRAERAHHLEAAVAYRWNAGFRLQLTGFARRERDMLRLTDNDYRLEDGRLMTPSLTPSWENTLDGTASGFEVLAERQAANGLSGWAAYTFARTQYADRQTGERYAADFDQRHTVTVYGQYRLTPATSTSAKLRLGSNVPIPGYLDEQRTAGNDALFVGDQRNTVRLPAYARLDLRANHAFNFETRRLTLFVELVNVTGRANFAPGYDAMRVLSTGRVISSRQQLFPFLPTAGILVEF